MGMDRRLVRFSFPIVGRIAIAAAAICCSASHSVQAATCRVPLPLAHPTRISAPPLAVAPRERVAPAKKPIEAGAAGFPLAALPMPAIKPRAPSVPLPQRAPKRVSGKRDPGVELPLRKPGRSDPDLLVNPLLNYALSKADKSNLKAAAGAISKRRFDQAQGAMKRIEDSAARKLAEWLFVRVRGTRASAAQIEAFRKANPLWPGQRRLRRRAEGALLASDVTPEAILAFFRDKGPVTGAGKAALAGAYLKTGDRLQAERLIVSAWRHHLLDKATQKLVMKRFAGLLTRDDHKARIDKLLYQGRRSLIAPALRIAGLLGDAETAKVKARAAAIRRSRAAGKLLEKAATGVQDVGVTFHRIQWLRRNKREQEAWTLLQDAPTDRATIVDVDKWWVERMVNARDALTAGCLQMAYDVVSRHGPVSSRYAARAAFMAGWIALQFLDKPALAKSHFLTQRNAATGPKAVARAEYWLGRTARALELPQEAKAHFAKAAQHGTTFHGLLALQSLDRDATKFAMPKTPKPSHEDMERLMTRDAARALGVMRAAGLQRYTRRFLYHLARTLDSPAEIALLAEYATAIDKLQASVRLAKLAFNRGLPLAKYAFPVDVLPDYRRLNDGVELALLHALTRQESEFNTIAKSHAGARGLMQIMPRTARAIARSYKVRYRVAKLTRNPSFNVMLGDAHLRDLIDEFAGSYIMAMAAYNAGGPRVIKWVRTFGDPRNPEIDPLDWIEQIPFTETRRYVQKILTGLQIYRARLNGAENALRILHDLDRGKRAPVAAFPVTESHSENLSLCHIVAPDRSVQLICY